MRPACRLAASSVSWGPSTLSTRSFISSAALVAASTSSPVNDAALGLLAWSAPNTMIAGAGLGSAWLILACGLGFDLLVIVYCLLRIRRGPEMAPLRVRSDGWRRGRRARTWFWLQHSGPPSEPPVGGSACESIGFYT